jgi:hypothetical protein
MAIQSVLQRSYSLDEFARLNDIALTTVRGEIKSGRLVARKVGRRTIITPEDADDWRNRLPKVQPQARVASIESVDTSDKRTPQAAIRAELIADDSCSALGMTVRGPAPVLALCRLLVEAGHDPATPLEAWRGDVPCLRIRSIGAAAALRIGTHGVGFETLSECTAASPVEETPVRLSPAAGRLKRTSKAAVL